MSQPIAGHWHWHHNAHHFRESRAHAGRGLLTSEDCPTPTPHFDMDLFSNFGLWYFRTPLAKKRKLSCKKSFEGPWALFYGVFLLPMLRNAQSNSANQSRGNKCL
jgi:hypothetical protein